MLLLLLFAAAMVLMLLLQAFRQAWSSSAMGAIDMSVLTQFADPMTVAKAQKDPEVGSEITRQNSAGADPC